MIRVIHTVLAALVLALGTPKLLPRWTAGLRHGLVAAFALAGIPVLVGWTHTGVVGAVVDLAA
jgi:hypothetical protein